MQSSIEILGKILLQFQIAIAKNIVDSQSLSNRTALLSSMYLVTYFGTPYFHEYRIICVRTSTKVALESIKIRSICYLSKKIRYPDCNPIADMAVGAISDCECKIVICDISN